MRVDPITWLPNTHTQTHINLSLTMYIYLLTHFTNAQRNYSLVKQFFLLLLRLFRISFTKLHLVAQLESTTRGHFGLCQKVLFAFRMEFNTCYEKNIIVDINCSVQPSYHHKKIKKNWCIDYEIDLMELASSWQLVQNVIQRFGFGRLCIRPRNCPEKLH